MKNKFLIPFIALCLTLSLPSFAKEATLAATNTEEVSAKDIENIKTFNFEKIFAEVDQYFEAAKSWQRLKCTPQTGFVCAKKECPKIKLTQPSCLILDRKSETITLCQNQICHYYPAKFEQTGVFINAKIENSNGIYFS